LAIALHAHIDRGERRGPKLRRAPRVAVVCANALEEVAPQGGGVVALKRGRDELAGAWRRGVRPLRTVADILRQNLHAEVAPLLALRPGTVAEFDRREPAADYLVKRVIVDHGRRDDELAAL